MFLNTLNQNVTSPASFYDYVDKIKTGYISFVKKGENFQPIIVKTDIGEIESFLNLNEVDSKFLFWIGDTIVNKCFGREPNVDEETRNTIEKMYGGEIRFFQLNFFKF